MVAGQSVTGGPFDPAGGSLEQAARHLCQLSTGLALNVLVVGPGRFVSRDPVAQNQPLGGAVVDQHRHRPEHRRVIAATGRAPHLGEQLIEGPGSVLGVGEDPA